MCTQNAHWTDVISENACNCDDISAGERRRRDAVWELFTSECVFLLDHLMALKHVNDTFSYNRLYTVSHEKWHLVFGNNLAKS